jgi:hypothetical protein
MKEEVKTMARFLAAHTLPGYNEEKFMAMSKQMETVIPKGLSWKLTYCAFDHNKYFCEWDAPSKEALEQSFKQNNFPFDAIYPVKQFNVSKKAFEV